MREKFAKTLFAIRQNQSAASASSCGGAATSSHTVASGRGLVLEPCSAQQQDDWSDEVCSI